MYNKCLKVKLYGLGWETDPEVKSAYLDLRNALAEVLRDNEHFAGMLKSVELVICNEHDSIHSVEDKETFLLIGELDMSSSLRGNE